VKPEELRKMAGTLADVLPIEILPEMDRRELAGHMALRKFKQDEVVYHQGDPAAHWFCSTRTDVSSSSPCTRAANSSASS